MASDSLNRVKRASTKTTQAREALEAAIVAAHENGSSLRAIAGAADMAHETVRTIIQGRKKET
jgi:hypothetical protein